jgi:hypothetical protein
MLNSTAPQNVTQRKCAKSKNAPSATETTLSLLKQHPEKDSVAMKRRACGWNEDYMLQVLTGTSR